MSEDGWREEIDLAEGGGEGGKERAKVTARRLARSRRE